MNGLTRFNSIAPSTAVVLDSSHEHREAPQAWDHSGSRVRIFHRKGC